MEGGGMGWYFWGVRTEKGTDRTPRAMQRFSGWNGAFLPSLPAPCLHHPGKKNNSPSAPSQQAGGRGGGGGVSQWALSGAVVVSFRWRARKMLPWERNSAPVVWCIRPIALCFFSSTVVTRHPVLAVFFLFKMSFR